MSVVEIVFDIISHICSFTALLFTQHLIKQFYVVKIKKVLC